MLNAVRGRGGAKEPARWYPEERTGEYKAIEVSVVSEQERGYSTLLQNFVTTETSTVLRTGFTHDYRPRQEIFYREKWWEIVNVGDDTQSVNPQTMRLVKTLYTAGKLIELIGVD